MRPLHRKMRDCGEKTEKRTRIDEENDKENEEK